MEGLFFPVVVEVLAVDVVVVVAFVVVVVRMPLVVVLGVVEAGVQEARMLVKASNAKAILRMRLFFMMYSFFDGFTLCALRYYTIKWRKLQPLFFDSIFEKVCENKNKNIVVSLLLLSVVLQ